MDAKERQILRAELVASGVIRYWQWDKSKRELDRWLEVMAEEFANLKEPDVVLKIRENLLTYGLRIPEISRPVHADTPVRSQIPVVTYDAGNDEVCRGLTKADPRGPGMHSAVSSDAEVQQKPDTYQGQEVCGAYKNIYLSKDDAVCVHPSHIGGPKTKQNAADDLSEGLSKGFTSAIPKRGQVPSKEPTGSATWRYWNYHRVPSALEQAVYEKFNQGWNKSKLAREFRLNRRTVIRICRKRDGAVTRNGES